MDRWREMESFVAVAESGSFVAAADVLRISKAAISRNVAELEGRLGARLLQRTTRRVSLTEAGRSFYGRCKQVLADLDEAESAVGAVTGRPVGRLRANAPFSFGVLHLAPLWGRFLRRYPEVDLDITLSDRMVDVVEEGFDVVIRITRLQDSTLVHRKLASTRVHLCAAPEYLARYGMPQSVPELARHRIIAYSYALSGDVWRFRTRSGEEEVRIRPTMYANNGETCRAVALDGHGIVLQPDFLVGEDLREGRLVRLLPDCESPEVGIYAVYPSRKHLSVKVRALVDFLAEAFHAPAWRSGACPDDALDQPTSPSKS